MTFNYLLGSRTLQDEDMNCHQNLLTQFGHTQQLQNHLTSLQIWYFYHLRANYLEIPKSKILNTNRIRN